MIDKRDDNYGPVLETSWCKDHDDIDYWCQAEDQICLVIGKEQCDKDPKCFGFSWFHGTDMAKSILVKLKLCRSTETQFKDDGWRTIMKVPKGTIHLFCPTF